MLPSSLAPNRPRPDLRQLEKRNRHGVDLAHRHRRPAHLATAGQKQQRQLITLDQFSRRQLVDRHRLVEAAAAEDGTLTPRFGGDPMLTSVPRLSVTFKRTARGYRIDVGIPFKGLEENHMAPGEQFNFYFTFFNFPN